MQGKEDGLLILASQSASRRAMLEAAQIAHRAVPAAIDEREIEAAMQGASAGEVALKLAGAKAQEVARKHPHLPVLASDSLVMVEGKRFDKPASREEAREHLRFFSGRLMELYSAAVLMEGDASWQHVERARLHWRALSDEFIEAYLDTEWPAIGHCAGAFRLEGLGVQLFDRIEGDHFTILGMPLLAVLAALREKGVIAQ